MSISPDPEYYNSLEYYQALLDESRMDRELDLLRIERQPSLGVILEQSVGQTPLRPSTDLSTRDIVPISTPVPSTPPPFPAFLRLPSPPPFEMSDSLLSPPTSPLAQSSNTTPPATVVRRSKRRVTRVLGIGLPYQKMEKKTLKRTAWNEKEELQITSLFSVHKNSDGTPNWPKIADLIGSRTTKQCREHWAEYSDPTLIRDKWTDTEKAILVEGVRTHGRKWTLIAPQLPGRSLSRIKSLWLSLEKTLNKA